MLQCNTMSIAKLSCRSSQQPSSKAFWPAQPLVTCGSLRNKWGAFRARKSPALPDSASFGLSAGDGFNSPMIVSAGPDTKEATPIPDLPSEETKPQGAAEPSVQVVGTFIEGGGDRGGVKVETDGAVAPARGLKINQDLQLYKCRQLRHKAFYCEDKNQRKSMLRKVEAGFLKAIDMDPTDGRAYVSLGKHYIQQRRFDDAIQIYEDGCAATQGQNPFIWQAWATAEAKKGNVTSARKLYDAATVASDSHVTAWHGWGMLEKRQGNFARARELWVKGLQKAKEPNEYLYQSLGLLAGQMGRIGEARDWFQQGTNSVKGRSVHAIYQAWALMEIKHGDPATVRYLFQKGIKCNPKARYLYLAWGDWEQTLGFTSRARKILEKGLLCNPRDPALYQRLGLLEETDGNFDLARYYFQEGLEVDDRHIPIWQAWGVLEWRCGDYEKARKLLQKGIWADPKSRDVCLVFQAWGCLERDDGNVNLARNLLKCAVKADPSSEVSWLAWAQLEESLGLYSRANDIRNFSMQERVEVVTPQLTSTDLAMGREDDTWVEGVSPSSFEKAIQQIANWLNTSGTNTGKTSRGVGVRGSNNRNQQQ